jgi:hypothetical protein
MEKFRSGIRNKHPGYFFILKSWGLSLLEVWGLFLELKRLHRGKEEINRLFSSL